MRTGRACLLVCSLALLIAAPGAIAQDVNVDSPYAEPYEGMWIPAGEPGSGLMIDQQGDTLVVTVFTYREDGTPAWYLASGPLEQGVFEAEAFEYGGGACLNCDWRPAQAGASKSIRLEFVARRLAWLSWDGGERIPVRELPFASGGPSLEPAYDAFGPPSVPDLAGGWLFTGTSVATGVLLSQDFDQQFVLDPGGYGWFAGSGNFDGWVECLFHQHFPDNGEANCQLVEGTDSPAVPLLTAYWGDVDPTVMMGYAGSAVPAPEAPRGDDPVPGFRLTQPHVVERPDGSQALRDEPPLYLEKGMWTVPGEPGSGLMFDWQDETLVFVVFSYDTEGDPVWYQGAGQVEDGTVDAQAHQFTGGTCLNCPYADSQQPGDPVDVHIEFTSKTTAYLSFAGGESTPIRALAFDSPIHRAFGDAGDFGRPALYDLRGDWAFVSTEGLERFYRRVHFSTPVRWNDGDTVSWKNDAGDVALRCDAEAERFASPQCRLLANGGEGWVRLMSAHWSDVGEDQIIGYEGPPLPGDDGRTRGRRLIFGFRLSGPDTGRNPERLSPG